MFRPQKPQQQPTRHRLPLVERPPKQEDVVTLFTGALRIRGCVFELPLKPNPTASTYLITCHFDQAINETTWAMYEGEAGHSPLWSFPQSDLDMIYDMICMACQPKTSLATQIPPELAHKQDPYSSSAPATNPPPSLEPVYTMPAQPNLASSPEFPELTRFINLIDKGQPNLLLGHLFVESGMVPERCLDAALKLQDLVRKGKLTNEQAILSLKKAAELGGILDDDIIEWAKDPEKARAKVKAASQEAKSQAESSTPRENATVAKAIELLKQSGLVSETDLETARNVKAKHGGNLGQILVAANKISGKTLEAAYECQEYVTNSLLRIDQAITALHYCERMRTGLKEALEELGIELA